MDGRQGLQRGSSAPDLLSLVGQIFLEFSLLGTVIMTVSALGSPEAGGLLELKADLD